MDETGATGTKEGNYYLIVTQYGGRKMLKQNFLLISDKDNLPIPLTGVDMSGIVFPGETERFTFTGCGLTDYKTFQVVELSQENSYCSKPLYAFSAKLYDANNDLVCEFINVIPTGCYEILGIEMASILVDNIRFNKENKTGFELYLKHQENIMNAKKEPEITFHYPDDYFFGLAETSEQEPERHPHEFFWDDEF